MHLFWHRLITVCYAGATILLRYFYCKKAIRIISGGNTKSHTEPIFKLYNLLKIADIYKSKLLILYYKILKFSSPRYFDSFLPKNSAGVSRYPIRNLWMAASYSQTYIYYEH